ncbi:MAG TPA: tetratricopeptide repeat protein [Acidobacteriota bacterium]|nr:tetratricopeptide repeat protein [Acidobacteriota bacterium]
MKTMRAVIVVLFISGLLYAQEPEATSLLGKPLYAPELSAEARAEYEKNLEIAKQDYEKSPQNADAIIWLGRRIGYLGEFNKAIEIFTQGIEKFPGEARFYRHRGHRYLTIRQIDKAISDLENAASLIQGRADQIEPDGIPNEKNIPTSTLQSNIWYHLGLAYYLKGDFTRAARAYRECMRVSKNDDMYCATAHWLYMTLRRLNHREEAAALLETIRKDMNLIENMDYHQLLLMYKGLVKPADLMKKAEDDLANATIGYGIANWYLYNGDSRKAYQMFEDITKGKMWPAFGYLAAEAELARSKR